MLSSPVSFSLAFPLPLPRRGLIRLCNNAETIVPFFLCLAQPVQFPFADMSQPATVSAQSY
jgi:hypothetical protein